METKLKFALFDIDGTLADISHRRHLLEKKPQDWKAFFDQIGGDTPNQAVVNLYHLVWNSDDFRCVIVTGRPEQYRKITEQWLTWNEIPFDRLLMRPKNDQRPDHVVKQEFLAAMQSRGMHIEFVVDDRKSVVDMWRRNGLTCLQCADFNG